MLHCYLMYEGTHYFRMLKLKLQYFGHLMRRADSFEKTLMLGKIEGRRRGRQRMRWDGWMASPTQWTWVWVDSASWWWTGRPGVLRFMGSQWVGHDWATDLNWSDLMVVLFLVFKGISIQSSIVAISNYIPTNSARAFPFLHTLSSIYCLHTLWWWPFWLIWGDISLYFWFVFCT